MFPPDQARWFAEEVKLHEPILRGYLQKRFPSLPDHDDIVQETYSRLLRTRDKGRLTSTKAFLFTVARNVAIDLLRRRPKVEHEPISDLHALPVLEEAPSAEESLERQQRRENLIEAIASLPDRCREVLMLRHLDGLPYKEIAVRLGISPNTVKVHMAKGVRDLISYFRTRGFLEGEFSSPSESTPAADSSEAIAP